MTSEELRALALRIDATDYLTRTAPLPESGVVAFEEEHRVALPEQYRRLLLELADGIDSDAVPLVGLDEAVGLSQGRALAKPFPYGDTYATRVLGALSAGETWASVMAQPDVKAGQFTGMPPGCLVIGDFGGGEYSLLVVTGEQRGKIWRHGQVDCPETPAHYGPGPSTPLEVDAWLACWAKENGLKLA